MSKQELTSHPGGKAPNLVVVMGVSGSGKSTVAQKLADALSYRCLDADDYHSEEAKQRMASGIPLTNEMRKPWVRSICGHLKQLARMNVNCTLAFSGLRKDHRDQIRDAGYNITFLFLNGDKATIKKRMSNRDNHFMPAKLLDSQFETLERPTGEQDVLTVAIDTPIDAVVANALQQLSPRLLLEEA